MDFFWPAKKLIGRGRRLRLPLSPRAAFERDRERDQHLTLAGYTVVRFTYHQVTQTPEAVAHRIRRLLP